MLHILRLQLQERASIYDLYARILFSTKFGENHEFQTLKIYNLLIKYLYQNEQLRVLSRRFLGDGLELSSKSHD